MAKNLYRLWAVLLIVSGAIALWFSGIAFSSLWKYTFLNTQASAKIISWQAKELSSSRFALEAEFEFEQGGILYKGKTVFENPQFLNRYAAENYGNLVQTQSWKAWHRASNPNKCSLEREFPQKKCLHALLTVGVFAYFYFSRVMLSRFLGESVKVPAKS